MEEFNVTVEEIIGKYLYRFGVEGLSFLFILFLLISVFILMEDNLNRTPNAETIKAKTDIFNSKFKIFCAFKKTSKVSNQNNILGNDIYENQ